jgi:transposase-like protein
MKQSRPTLFRGRHFDPEVIVTCVRWYLRFSLSLRNVEELMRERGLIVDHTTVMALVPDVRTGRLPAAQRKR